MVHLKCRQIHRLFIFHIEISLRFDDERSTSEMLSTAWWLPLSNVEGLVRPDYREQSSPFNGSDARRLMWHVLLSAQHWKRNDIRTRRVTNEKQLFDDGHGQSTNRPSQVTQNSYYADYLERFPKCDDEPPSNQTHMVVHRTDHLRLHQTTNTELIPNPFPFLITAAPSPSFRFDLFLDISQSLCKNRLFTLVGHPSKVHLWMASTLGPSMSN